MFKGSLTTIYYSKLYSLAHLHSYVFCLFFCYFLFCFIITAAGVMTCGGPKKSPRTASIVKIIFYVRSFDISDYILRTQELYLIGLKKLFRLIFGYFGAILDMFRSSDRLHRLNFLNCSLFSEVIEHQKRKHTAEIAKSSLDYVGMFSYLTTLFLGKHTGGSLPVLSAHPLVSN